MSRLRYTILLAFLLAGACGSSDDPKIYEQVLLNDTVTVAAGASQSVLFAVDLTEVSNPQVNAVIQANGSIKVYLLTEAEYDKWSEGLEFTAVYQSDEESLVKIQIPITATGRYSLLISNAHDLGSAKQVVAYVSIRFEEV